MPDSPTRRNEPDTPIRRGWAFNVGDRVTCRDNFGPFVCDLSIRRKDNPDAIYEVAATGAGGRWLLLLGDDGKFYGGIKWSWYERDRQPEPGIGHCYFRLVGDCDCHAATYNSLDYAEPGWYCSRCDEPIARADVPGLEAQDAA